MPAPLAGDTKPIERCFAIAAGPTEDANGRGLSHGIMLCRWEGIPSREKAEL